MFIINAAEIQAGRQEIFLYLLIKFTYIAAIFIRLKGCNFSLFDKLTYKDVNPKNLLNRRREVMKVLRSDVV